MAYVVKTGISPLVLTGAIRQAVWELDPDLPVAEVRALTDIVHQAEAPMAFAMLLIAIAAAVALVLGLVGVYGVLSYTVSERRSEIGLRVAFGAGATDVSRMILRQGAFVALIGIVPGLAGAAAVTRFMGALLFNVQPTDAGTYALVSIALFAVSVLAGYVPARRAARQDPMQALRAE